MADLTPAQKLARFCFIGSFDPVVIYRCDEIDVAKFLPFLNEIYANINFVSFITPLKHALNVTPQPIFEEPLFALAAFLTNQTIKDDFRAMVIRSFPSFILTDGHLFYFLKQAKRILVHTGRKSFPKPVIKSVRLWYQKQTIEKIYDMSLKNLSAYGFNHYIIFKIFHVCRRMLVKENTMNQYYMFRYREIKAKIQKKELPEPDYSKLVPQISFSIYSDLYRKDSKTHRILWKINHFKLKYDQLPMKVRRKCSVLSLVYPSINSTDFVKIMRRYYHYKYDKHAILSAKLVQTLQSPILWYKDRTPPINVLIDYQRIPAPIRSPITTLAKDATCLLVGRENLKICIALNLQQFYLKKKLRNYKDISYFNAAVTLAWGFARREPDVTILHWTEEVPGVAPLALPPNNDFKQVLEWETKYVNMKNKQNIKAVINYADAHKKAYDLILCIGPKFRKSVPGNTSESIKDHLHKYRTKYEAKTKLVLLSLLEHKRPSMSYNSERNDSILEILGLDKDTVKLIDGFAMEKFF